MTQQICRRNKFGYCQYGDKCRFRHNDKVCVDKICKIVNCENRHPRSCKFQREYGRCKFTTYCKYNHDKNKDIAENSDKIEEIEKKLNEIEIIAKMNTPVEREVEKKMDNFEKQIKTMQKALEEKDSSISELKKRLEHFEKKITNEKNAKDKVIDKKIKDLEELIKKQSKKKGEQFSCTSCEFKTTSSQGLKTHIKRKHTKLNEEIYPKNCELCETEIANNRAMHLHLKTHSYRDGDELKFKCEDCEFWGPNNLTMEVHAGKAHSDIIQCGLCDFKAKDLEKLETHLSTCETYECDLCYFRVTKICEIKTHMMEKHENENVKIIHGKQDRKNEEEIDCAEHLRFDLFPKVCLVK